MLKKKKKKKWVVKFWLIGWLIGSGQQPVSGPQFLQLVPCELWLCYVYRTDVVPTTQRGNCSCAIKENPFRIFQFPRVTSALHCFIYSFIIISIIFLDPGLLALPSLGRFNKKYTRKRTRTDAHLKDVFALQLYIGNSQSLFTFLPEEILAASTFSGRRPFCWHIFSRLCGP